MITNMIWKIHCFLQPVKIRIYLDRDQFIYGSMWYLLGLNSSWLEFELCVIPLKNKTRWTFWNLSSKRPQNHDWFTFTYSQALPSLLHTNHTCFHCYFCSSVARAFQRHHKSIHSNPAGGPIIDSSIAIVPGLNFSCVWFPLKVKTLWTFKIYPTSSEAPKNLNWFILTYSRALPSLIHTNHARL